MLSLARHTLPCSKSGNLQPFRADHGMIFTFHSYNFFVIVKSRPSTVECLEAEHTTLETTPLGSDKLHIKAIDDTR